MSNSLPAVNKSPTESIDALTGLRGAAALWVVLFHAGQTLFAGMLLPVGIGNFIGSGWLAVDLFFVLSGFIISYVHLNDFSQPWSDAASRFLKLRLARIYPAHVVAVLCWVPALAIAMIYAPRLADSHGLLSNFNPRTFAFAITLLNGWGIPGSQGWNLPSWSVGSEWFAYLSFPLLALGLLRIRSARGSVLLLLAVGAICVTLSIEVNDSRLYMLPESYTLFRVESEFIIGCLSYLVFQRSRDTLRKYPLAYLALFGILLLATLTKHGLLDGFFVLLFPVLIVGLACKETRVSRILGLPISVYLGKISYSVYLVHALVIVALRQAMPMLHSNNILSWIVPTALYFSVVLIAGAMLHRVVEEPARIFLRRKWIDRANVQPRLISPVLVPTE